MASANNYANQKSNNSDSPRLINTPESFTTARIQCSLSGLMLGSQFTHEEYMERLHLDEHPPEKEGEVGQPVWRANPNTKDGWLRCDNIYVMYHSTSVSKKL